MAEHAFITDLLNTAGTDKGKWYGGLYEVLFRPIRLDIRCVVEIGIGTLSPDRPSNMCGYAAAHYRPGGSLRAWRDYFPNAHIYGFDIAPDTQFLEPRITTYLCDSTRDEARRIASEMSPKPDLIIDDGLHTAEAQRATIRNFFPSLRSSGIYIVEDVFPTDVDTIIEELRQLAPKSAAFVDRSWGSRVAIVSRK